MLFKRKEYVNKVVETEITLYRDAMDKRVYELLQDMFGDNMIIVSNEECHLLFKKYYICAVIDKNTKEIIIMCIEKKGLKYKITRKDVLFGNNKLVEELIKGEE